MTTPQQPPWPPAGSYGPPPGYGPPPQPGQVPMAYGFPVAPQTDGTAICVLVLAISSFVVLPVIPAIVALVLAPSAERAILASGGRLTGESLVRAGRVVAWVHLALCVAFALFVVAVFGLLGAASVSD